MDGGVESEEEQDLLSLLAPVPKEPPPESTTCGSPDHECLQNPRSGIMHFPTPVQASYCVADLCAQAFAA